MRQTALVVGLALTLLAGSSQLPVQAALVDVFDITGTAVFDPGQDLWLYEYAIQGSGAPHGLSHWWLELPEIKAESIQDPGGPDSGPEWTTEYPQFSEPVAASLTTAQGVDLSGGHAELLGIKWEAPKAEDCNDCAESDFKDGVLSGFFFYSSHGPSAPDAYTWFTKFGRDGYDYGTTIGPNGHENHSPIPEPGTMALMGLGLAGTRLFRRRRR
ncbi:MAG: PEP-CTERM sorting domain-containing protein [Candidatus Omnitrophica bacterium]|nr:PEP-CTERM sorting domain-containing protein [Candidatus Omnitrophota bacterium]